MLGGEERVPPTELVPAVKTARIEATVQHQKELEDELERLMPSLYRKAQDLKPDDGWDIKAPIVEHLSRGLEKLQQSGRGGGTSTQPSYPDKLRQDRYGGVVGDSDEESQAKDSAYQKTGVTSPPDDSSGQGADSRKGRGRNVWKMLRSGR